MYPHALHPRTYIWHWSRTPIAATVYETTPIFIHVHGLRSSHRLAILHFLHQLNSNIFVLFYDCSGEYIKLKIDESISPNTQYTEKTYARNKRSPPKMPKKKKKEKNEMRESIELDERIEREIQKKTPPIRRYGRLLAFVPTSRHTHTQAFVLYTRFLWPDSRHRGRRQSSHTHTHTHSRFGKRR